MHHQVPADHRELRLRSLFLHCRQTRPQQRIRSIHPLSTARLLQLGKCLCLPCRSLFGQNPVPRPLRSGHQSLGLRGIVKRIEMHIAQHQRRNLPGRRLTRLRPQIACTHQAEPHNAPPHKPHLRHRNAHRSTSKIYFRFGKPFQSFQPKSQPLQFSLLLPQPQPSPLLCQNKKKSTSCPIPRNPLSPKPLSPPLPPRPQLLPSPIHTSLLLNRSPPLPHHRFLSPSLPRPIPTPPRLNRSPP